MRGGLVIVACSRLWSSLLFLWTRPRFVSRRASTSQDQMPSRISRCGVNSADLARQNSLRSMNLVRSVRGIRWAATTSTLVLATRFPRRLSPASSFSATVPS